MQGQRREMELWRVTQEDDGVLKGRMKHRRGRSSKKEDEVKGVEDSGIVWKSRGRPSERRESSTQSVDAWGGDWVESWVK